MTPDSGPDPHLGRKLEVPSSTSSPFTGPGGATPDRETLDRSLVTGVAWTSGIKWGAQAVTWAITLLVMRLLTPADYGLVGMAGIFLGLVTLVSEFGLGSAVVALRTLTTRQIAQLNSVAVVIGFFACLLSAAAAKSLAEFFHSPRLVLVTLALSGTFVVSALSVVPAAILRRDLKYRTLALVEAARALGNVITTLVLAWLGFGYWSLVVGQLAMFVVGSGALLWVSPQRFALPRIEEIRHALTFSVHVVTGRIGWYAYSKADYLTVGKLLGQAALGAYTVAFDLSRLPVDKITGMVTRVSPGIFSATQEDAVELRRHLLHMSEGLSLVTFAPILGLGLVAPQMIPIVLGKQWTGAIVPLQILSIGAAVRGVTPLLPQVLNVVGETAYVMRRTLLAVLLFVPSFYVGARAWGVTGVAWAWVILEPIVVSLPILLKVRQKTGLALTGYASALWPAVSGCMPMAAAVILLRTWGSPRLSPAILLTLEVALGTVVYSLAVFLFHGERIRQRIRAIRRVSK